MRLLPIILAERHVLPLFSLERQCGATICAGRRCAHGRRPFVPAEKILFAACKFSLSAQTFFIISLKVFVTKFLTLITNFVTCITNLLTCVTKFVTCIRNFVINFLCADSENYHGFRKNFLADGKNYPP